MVSAFDRLVIAVPNLEQAAEEYRQLLLGVAPAAVTRGGTSILWFILANTVIELVQATIEQAYIQGIVFADVSAGASDMPLANGLGLDLSLCDGVLSRRQTDS